MRSMAIVRKITSTIFSISLTCSARICKSGSAIVTMTPMTKLIKAISQIFLLFVRVAPTFCPMTSMDISAPSANSAVPTISSNTPREKSRKVPVFKGVSVSDNPSTIKAMGNTA